MCKTFEANINISAFMKKEIEWCLNEPGVLFLWGSTVISPQMEELLLWEEYRFSTKWLKPRSAFVGSYSLGVTQFLKHATI